MTNDVTCIPCHRTFRSQIALDAHRRNSFAHAHKCATCREGFWTQSDLLRHTSSTGHIARTFKCEPCARSFSAEETFRAHCESRLHRGMTQSPMNAFFHSWPNFPFNVMLPPHESWDQLQVFYGWEDNEAAYRAAWIRYQDALAMEVTVWFGKAWLLNSWTELFYALGMRDPPINCAEGELTMQSLFVNIIDLIHWVRTSGAFGGVVSFRDRVDFSEYSADSKKVFQRDQSGNDQNNVVLQHLTHCMLPRELPPTSATRRNPRSPRFWFSEHRG